MIALGHSPRDVWSYTPRRISAFLFLAEKRETRERAERLTVATLAARGDGREVKKALKDWGRDA